MNTVEPEPERLAHLYAAMSDEELEKLAASGYELCDVAHQALKAEISRRGLRIEIAANPGVDIYELNGLITVRQFRDLHEALLAKGCLESADIHAELVDDNMVRLDWFYSNLLGGIKLKVRPEDVEAANQILDQPVPEQFEVEGVGTYEQPRCLRCQSLDVSYQELNKPVGFGSAYLGVPIPVHAKGWICHACKHQWEENIDTEPTLDNPAT